MNPSSEAPTNTRARVILDDSRGIRRCNVVARRSSWTSALRDRRREEFEVTTPAEVERLAQPTDRVAEVLELAVFELHACASCVERGERHIDFGVQRRIVAP